MLYGDVKPMQTRNTATSCRGWVLALGCAPIILSGCAHQYPAGSSGMGLPAAPIQVPYVLQFQADCQSNDTWTEACRAEFAVMAEEAAEKLLGEILGPSVQEREDAMLVVGMIYSQESKLFRSRGTVFLTVETPDQEDVMFVGAGHGYVNFTAHEGPLDYSTCYKTMSRCVANVAPRMLRTIDFGRLESSPPPVAPHASPGTG